MDCSGKRNWYGLHPGPTDPHTLRLMRAIVTQPPDSWLERCAVLQFHSPSQRIECCGTTYGDSRRNHPWPTPRGQACCWWYHWAYGQHLRQDRWYRWVVTPLVACHSRYLAMVACRVQVGAELRKALCNQSFPWCFIEQIALRRMPSSSTCCRATMISSETALDKQSCKRL